MEFAGIALSVMFSAGCVRIGRVIRSTSGTTLRAPAIWLGIAWCLLAGCEYITWSDERLVAAKWRYLATVSTYCPAMALLGAKRPQDRGWQFIVATLWLVLALPALQSLALTPSAPWQLHPAFNVLLVVLTLMQVTNYLPTRYGWSAVLSGCAQGAFLWREAEQAGSHTALWPWSLAIASLLLARGVPRERSEYGWNVVWRDFRNAYGCVWGLRVAERVNQVASETTTSSRLEWHGFASSAPASTGEESATQVACLDAAQEVALRGILRRFVSDEWIALRLDRHAPQDRAA